MSEAARLYMQTQEEVRGDDERQPDQLGEVVALLGEVLRELKGMNSKNGRNTNIDSPWLSLSHAARYCDYSPEHFRDLVKEFEIPTHGPQDNRFNRFELDRWLEEPKCFKSNNARVVRRRTGEFKIKDIMWDFADSEDSGLEGEWVFVGSGVEESE